MAIVELYLKDVTPFRTAIHALVDHIPQANLQFTKDGLTIGGMDNSHTSHLLYSLSNLDCTSYKCEQSNVVGMTLSMLDRVLRVASYGEEMTLTLHPGSDTIGLNLVNKALFLRRTFDLPTLDLTIDELKVPELDLAADITMSTPDFVGRVKEFAKFGAENLLLEVNEDGLRMEAQGDMKGSCLFEPTDDREIAMEGDCVSEIYSLKLLHGILVGAADLSSVIHISFEKEKPIRFRFIFGSSKFVSYTGPKMIDE